MKLATNPVLLAAAAAAICLGPLARGEEIPGAPRQSQQNAVGLSAQDGISMSGLDVLVTRNGVSQKLNREMQLDSGLKVEPDGTMIGTDGSKMLLKPDQILTFNGNLMNSPVLGNPPPTPGAAALPQTASGEK